MPTRALELDSFCARIFHKRFRSHPQVTIDTETLGKLYKIRIGHNNENPQSGWFLDKVKSVGCAAIT